MVKAAEGGRSDEMVELLNEGADIECKGLVRHIFVLRNVLYCRLVPVAAFAAARV